MGSRVVGVDLAKMIVDAWIGGKFKAERHAARVQMIADIENPAGHRRKRAGKAAGLQ